MQRDGHFERHIDLMGVSEAAKALGVSRQRIHQMINEGVIDYYQFGVRKLLHRADISKLIERRKREGVR